MTRYQATIDAITEQELEFLREKLGLREDQKANLLREITRLAVWCVNKAEAGSRIVAVPDNGAPEELLEPALERLRGQVALPAVLLSPQEATRLEELLNAPLQPTHELQRILDRLARGESAPPVIVWNEG